MALFWRIWAAVTVVTFAVLAIFVALATLQFDQVNTELVAERLSVLAHRTAAPFEAAAGIGLPLSTVRNAAALLERARQTDDAIIAIHVFDRDGRVAHSTDKSPPATIERTSPAGEAGRLASGDGFQIVFDIAGLGGDPVGGILVAYSGRDSTTRVRAMAAELALAAIQVLIASAILGGLLLRLGLAPQIRAFEAVDQAMASFERSSWRSTAAAKPGDTAASSTDDLRDLLDAADARYRAAGQAVAEAEESAPR